MEKEHIGYINLILYSALVGSVGVFLKLVHGMDANSVIFVRASLATLAIFLITISIKGWKELILQKPIQTLLTGIFQAVSIILYFYAILETSVANAVLLLYTAPIFTVIFARLLFKEKIRKETIIGILVTTIGIILILKPETFTFDTKSLLGNLAGLGGGFFYSVMAVTAKPIMKKVSGYNLAFWQYFIVSLIFVFLSKTESLKMAAENWWQLLIMGAICTGVGFIFFMKGIQKVKAQKIFIITALEPLTGTLLALIVLKEIPSWLTIIGAVLIFYGVYKVSSRQEHI